MKKLIKWFLIILSIIGVLVAIWYFYFFNSYMTLQEEDKNIIEKTLLTDSEGRGYSDFAKKNIEDGISILKQETSFSKEELENIQYFITLSSKYVRKSIFSKNKEEFVSNLIKYRQMDYCYGYSILHINKIDNKIYDKLKLTMHESKKTEQSFDVLIDKNLSLYSFKEYNSILNSTLPYEKCLEIKRDKSYE